MPSRETRNQIKHRRVRALTKTGLNLFDESRRDHQREIRQRPAQGVNGRRSSINAKTSFVSKSMPLAHKMCVTKMLPVWLGQHSLRSGTDEQSLKLVPAAVEYSPVLNREA